MKKMSLVEFLTVGKNFKEKLPFNVKKETAFKAIAHVAFTILSNPEKYNQKKWICKTSACMAGHCALMFKDLKKYDNYNSFGGVMLENKRFGNIFGAYNIADKVFKHFIEDKYSLYHFHQVPSNIRLIKYNKLYNGKHYKKALIATVLLYNLATENLENENLVPLLKEAKELQGLILG
jgi:hypothetical protein